MQISPPEDTARTHLAKNLKRFRLALGLSQEALAERAGLHRNYVGCIERNEKNVSLDSLERISKALGVPPEELISGDNK
jgi:transcriptional regulator with XRE-family HTH domain